MGGFDMRLWTRSSIELAFLGLLVACGSRFLLVAWDNLVKLRMIGWSPSGKGENTISLAKFTFHQFNHQSCAAVTATSPSIPDSTRTSHIKFHTSPHNKYDSCAHAPKIKKNAWRTRHIQLLRHLSFIIALRKLDQLPIVELHLQ